MALSLTLIDIRTGELLQAEAVNLSERQLMLIASYEEWKTAEKLCVSNNLTLASSNARRQQEYCRRDFLYCSFRQGRTLAIYT